MLNLEYVGAILWYIEICCSKDQTDELELVEAPLVWKRFTPDDAQDFVNDDKY